MALSHFRFAADGVYIDGQKITGACRVKFLADAEDPIARVEVTIHVEREDAEIDRAAEVEVIRRLPDLVIDGSADPGERLSG